MAPASSFFPPANGQGRDRRSARGHEAMLPKYTDREMHNMLAYLETLK